MSHNQYNATENTQEDIAQDSIRVSSPNDSSMQVDEHAQLSAVDHLLKKIDTAQARLDQIHRNAGDTYTEEERLAADEASASIEWLSKQVSAITKRADSKARPVNLNEIPRFQVVGQAKHWPDHPRFTTVDHFFSAFENVIRASGNEVNLVWKRYVPVSLPFDFESWTKNDLLACNDWDQAKALFRKHFGAPINSEESMAKLFSMRMKNNDTLQDYTNKFMKYVKDCGFPPNSNMLAKFYQFTLLRKNQQMMVNQMSVKHGSNHKWTINEIYECVLPLFLVDEQNRGDDDVEVNIRGKRKGGSGGSGGSGSRTKMARVSATGYFCAKHGGSNANHNTIDCKSRLKHFGSDNKPNRATTAAPYSMSSSSSDPKTCNFCGKPRAYGHRCQEFYDWKKERESRKNIGVHTVQTTTVRKDNKSGSGSETNDVTMESSTDSDIGDAVGDVTMEEIDACLDEIEAEDASLNCNLNFLSHSVKRLGKTPAIKIRYLNDIAFDHSFELSNFIQDLGDFDVLLGVDTLSRLRIGLTGVAHKFADIGHLTEEEKSELLESIDFENVNFDTKHSIDPETASIFESQAEENKYMSNIQDAIDENQRIKPGTFCNVPESEIIIPIKENVDYYVKQYPIAHHAMPEIEKQLNEWLDAGIVEQCRPNGLFNSPIIAVSKKDNDGKPTKTRVCMDVRRINQHMPNNTNQFEIFTRIKQKGTIFSKRKNLGHEHFVFCHCELIKEVLRRLTHANLKIGVEKCSWFRSSIYLLGFVVGPHVSKVDMRRLSDIDHWGPCRSAKQVKQLAGVISYLRPHIPNLSKLMAPIDALRNDPDAGSKWTDEHTKRLEIIKKVLLSEALLTAPDMNKKFYLECDASLYAVAVILTQRDDQGRTVYVAMLSKSLTKSQQNWPVLRRELYAVLFGLVRLRPLLYGHPEIEVMTDHRALIYIYTCKCPTRVIQNYMEILNEYPQLQFTHIKGLDNILPDKLSRLYEPLEDHTELAGDSDKKIAKLQKNIMRSKGSKKRFIGNNKQTKHYLTKNKVVYNKDKHLNVLAMKIKEGNYESVAYIAPPDNERDQLLRETHEFGHFGAASIVKKLHEEGIHWTGLYDDAKAICQSCMECARHNVVQKGYHELRNVVAYGPFDHIGIDFLGPLTPANNGNIYILVVYDICTRFIITRALPNKQTDTVARALTTIFGDFGIVQILQSDNGREFKSALMSEIGKALGINQRYSTAFHARGNGASESGVKNILNALRKMVSEHIYDWDSVLPGTQLAINTKIRYRTESAPFQLMFARPLNRFVDYDDPKIKDNLPKKPMTLGELRKKAEIMNQVVFPAINQRTQRIIEEQATRFNKHHKITHFKVGDWVMVRLPHRESKLEAAYDGPYQVVQKKRSTYVLKDDMNELLHRDYVPSELKLVAIDESIIEQEVYEVDEIRAHRGPEHNREYLVKWKTFGEAANSWETAASFNNPQTIRKYWAKIKEYELLEKRRQALNSDTASSKSKRKRDDSDKRLRGSKRLNVAEQ
ncbi:Methylcrotonoyl-CoA carboxylase beta chain, mitochondrial [Mucor velutinosus]|uniref:Methylcrotonoyl-CoA carboxylase beta chain, mitochondrial n=1 Tax=Mucor velutinosus TaxID=708070 RepID=A0AAN7I3D9_9FUNG|nr:Methylcrotonoyl-CoA carboxylase beta chain, mitochondrial [Mucor velutinosus]